MMNNKINLAAIFLVIFVGSCASSGDVSPQIKSCDELLMPSDLHRSGNDCDGRSVVVHGVLRVGPEMRGLWDSMSDIRNANYREACITIYDPEGRTVDHAISWVEVSGKFRAYRPDRLVILGACSDAILEVESVRDLSE